jgi:hypothetical protein
MKSGRLWTRNLAFIIVAATLAAIVTAGAVIAGPQVLTKRKYKQQTGIFAAFRDGPVNTTENLSPVASLTVPKGNYAINAKVELENRVSSGREYECRLTVGGATLDESEGGLGAVPGEETLTLPLQGVGTFAGNGTIVLLCSDGVASNNDDKAEFIRITAIRGRSLSNVPSH